MVGTACAMVGTGLAWFGPAWAWLSLEPRERVPL